MCNIKTKTCALKVANLIVVLLFFAATKNYAQDIHFSQLKSTPLFINPANTGTSFTDFRFTNDYRNQWHKIDYPYNTLMLAFDSRVPLFNRQFGVGALMLHDQSLGNYLNVDKYYLSFSHSFFYNNHQIVIGLQPGYVLKKYNNGNITFGNQFDPNSQNYNPNLPSNENNLNEDLNYFDLNAGLLWQTRIKNLIPAVGVSVNHVNRPKESFFSDSTATKLPMKYTIHGNILIPVTKKFLIEPQVLFSYTKGSKEFIGGAAFCFLPEEQNGIKNIYGISAMRINPVRNFDALILGGGAEIAGFDVCFTYDVNVSSLRKISRFQGAYEISLSYKINRKRVTNDAEPCFML